MRYRPPGIGHGRTLLALASLCLGACGSSRPVDVAGGPGDPGTPGGEACIADACCAGAAKIGVTPNQQHIDGAEEARLDVGPKLQQFNLGGFGINPLQNVPDPFAEPGTSLTQPAQLPVYESARHAETEHTWLRLLLLEHAQQRVVLVTLDAIGAGNLIQAGVRTAIVEASCARDACVESDHILFGQTHSHAGADLQGLWGGMPNDAGEPAPLQQPADITRFARAQFACRGGSTAVDNPRVTVQRETAAKQWTDHADQSGDVVTRVEFPEGVAGVLRPYVGLQEWTWTAGFEAYSAHPLRLGSTPPGRYRCVDGRTRQSFATQDYAFCSEPFTVSVWDGIGIENLDVGDDAIRFDIAAIVYPRTPGDTAFPFIADNDSARICDTCTFRPWAKHGTFERAFIEIVGAEGGTQRELGGARELPASCDAPGRACRVEVTLAAGDRATVRVFDRDGNTGRAGVRQQWGEADPWSRRGAAPRALSFSV